jgi:hypothetical protein
MKIPIMIERNRKRLLLVWAAMSVWLLAGGGAVMLAQYASLAEHPAIAYSKTAPTDAVARLQAAIEKGETVLDFDEEHGYLPAVLRALDVPVSSQSLVFSRTSLQVDRIAPWTPRALYFNDHVYVGWVQNGPIMEIASVDPKLGAVFYTVSQTAGATPIITRETRTCLQCHDSASSTGGVPGFIMRSTIADRHGYPVRSEFGASTDRTPLAERWGGWYVTGTIPAPHLGNAKTTALASEMGNVQSYLARTNLTTSGTVANLEDRFDIDPYLAKSSDAVALLVLAHQTYVHNLITAAGYQSLSAPDDKMRGEGLAERLVQALLFVGEAELPGPIVGNSPFATEFAKRAVRDQRGRSLRDLQLDRRLFKYPLSYLIYSEGFDALPQAVKQYVYRRLHDVLDGRDTNPHFAHLSSDDRTAIRAILEETKPEFARSGVTTSAPAPDGR